MAASKFGPNEENDARLWADLTQRGRRALCRAEEEAVRRGENQVKAEHLLLGILREDDNAARRLLKSLHIAPEELARQTESLLVPGPGRDETIPLRLDSRTEAALEHARAEAARVGNRFVGPEHLLLGLIAAQVGASGAVFRYHGPELDAARNAFENLRGSSEAPSPELAFAGGSVAGGAVTPRVQETETASDGGSAVRRWVVAILMLVLFYVWLRTR